jgi:hypothetical protein
MANVYKQLQTSDQVRSRTLLHEAIPITGTIPSGTYNETNIKNYAAKYFQSVYDYPYLSSSANHIFDITAGFSADSPFSGTNPHDLPVTASAKKINVYNEMAQVLMGYSGSTIRKFDRDGDFSTASDKMEEAVFLCFSRLLTKDEIKKGSFTLSFVTGGTVASRAYGATVALREIGDYGAATKYKVNSPAGEYGILYTSSAAPNADSGVGLIFYQAGVCMLTASVFTASGPVEDFFDNGGLGMEFGAANQTDLGAAGGGAAFGQGTAMTASINNSFVSATIQQMADGVRNCLYNLSFNNTTEVNSTIYFCRAHSSDFNYSTNPTYLSGSKIRVKNNSTDTPVAYLTTVGLYSANNELLAVAKVSEPIKKTPNNEATLRVRLDY